MLEAVRSSGRKVSDGDTVEKKDNKTAEQENSGTERLWNSKSIEQWAES
jgi:hypothetical protein